MKFSRVHTTLVSMLAAALSISIASAQDPSIDKLLGKLPPPEKRVKSPVATALQQTDPALRDPLVAQIGDAAKAQNFGRARDLAQQLTIR